MKIDEKHTNGATISVSGFRGVPKVVSEWRQAQAKTPAKEKTPTGFAIPQVTETTSETELS